MPVFSLWLWLKRVKCTMWYHISLYSKGRMLCVRIPLTTVTTESVDITSVTSDITISNVTTASVAIAVAFITTFTTVCVSVSASGSGRHKYGSGSGSSQHQAKIVRKTFISTVCRLLYDFLSLKNDVNVPVFRIRLRKIRTMCFWASRIRTRIR